MVDQQLTSPRSARPMMQNYGISADEEGLMSWEWVEEQMTKARNYWICTVTPEGKPHVAPVWGVWFEGALYFGTDRGSRKARNLAHHPEAVVHLESGDDAVILEGTIEELIGAEKALLTRIADAYGAKYPSYRPDFDADPPGFLLTLKPKKGFSWLEKDFPKTATRWQFGTSGS